MWNRRIERDFEGVLCHVNIITELRPKLPSDGSGIGELADGASGVQAVDDRVAVAILCSSVVFLGSNVVAAVTQGSKHIGRVS